jgi:hypothetical protein
LVEYFKISEGDIDGQLANFLLALEYRFSGIWGVGAGYRDVTTTRDCIYTLTWSTDRAATRAHGFRCNKFGGNGPGAVV